jgi:hypothetical protein
MSYQEKYLKYKSKYLQLKTLKKNLEQLGGRRKVEDSDSMYNDNFMSLGNLTETPTNTNNDFKRPESKHQESRSKYHKKSRHHKRNDTDSSDILKSTTTESSITDSFELSSSDEDL